MLYSGRGSVDLADANEQRFHPRRGYIEVFGNMYDIGADDLSIVVEINVESINDFVRLGDRSSLELDIRAVSL